MRRISPVRCSAAALMMVGALCTFTGCEEPREKVLDVEAPGFNMEVERSKDDADLDINTPESDTEIRINGESQ